MKAIKNAFACPILALFSTLAVAQNVPAQEVMLDIEAQPMLDALNKWAQQTGLQIVIPGAPLANLTLAKRVAGEFSAQEGLQQLLQGTSLSYEFINLRTVVIYGREAKASRPAGMRPIRLATEVTGEPRLTGGAVAQTNERESSQTDDDREKVVEEVIVSAQKRIERLQDVPISISVLGGNALDKSTFTGSLEALKTVPGIALLPNGGTGGGTMINIRGVGAAGAVFNGSSPVGYYLDSVPFSLIRDAITPDQSSFDLAQVEVLRGPQGTLYGASSVNGLVRVLTKDADLDEFEFKVRTTGSNTDGADDLNYRGDAAVNVPLIAGKLAARAVVGYDSSAGWVDSLREEDVNSARTRNYRLKLNAQPTNELSVGVSAWVNRADKNALAVSNQEQINGAAIAEPSTEDFETYSLNIGYELPSLSIASSTSYLDYEATGTIDAGSLGFGLPTSPVFSKIPSKSLSQEIIVNSSPDQPWKWTVGAFYRDIESGLLQTWMLFPRPISFTETSESMAVFGQLSHRFWNNKLEWTLGVRYFEDTIRHELDPISVPPTISGYRAEGDYDATTPRAVLSWYPTDNVTVYGSYAQGFRSGLPLSYTVGLSNPTFPDTKPDKLDNYELGVKLEMFDRRVSLDAAVYYIDWQDVQQSIAVPFNGTRVTAVVNGESASGAGIDLSVTVRPIEDLEFGATAGWNSLEIDDDVYVDASRTQQLFGKGDRLNASPELTSGAFVRYGTELGASGYRAQLSVSANYVSEMVNREIGVPRARIIAGDDLTFGQASFLIESPSGWSSSLFVDNFTNEDGAITGSTTVAGASRVPRPRPRTIGMQLDYHF